MRGSGRQGGYRRNRVWRGDRRQRPNVARAV